MQATRHIDLRLQRLDLDCNRSGFSPVPSPASPDNSPLLLVQNCRDQQEQRGKHRRHDSSVAQPSRKRRCRSFSRLPGLDKAPKSRLPRRTKLPIPNDVIVYNVFAFLNVNDLQSFAEVSVHCQLRARELTALRADQVVVHVKEHRSLPWHRTISSFAGVRQLSLRRTSASEDALWSLQALTHLTSLDLAESAVTDRGVSYLRAHAHLQSLDLSGCTRITNKALFYLQFQQELRNLCLAGCSRLTDAGLQCISPLSQLESLDISGCSAVSSQGLTWLKGNAHLTSLNLAHCYQVTDQALSSLATNHSSLKLLNLYGCDSITDDGISSLVRMQDLETLVLFGAGITDAGLLALQHLRKLTYLDITSRSVSQGAVQALAASLCMRVLPTGTSWLLCKPGLQ